MEDLFLKLGIWSVLKSAIAVTLGVSAFGVMIHLNKRKKKILVVVFSFIIASLEFYSGNSLDNAVIQFVLIWSFSILFYTYLGKYSVQKLFDYLKRKLNE